MMQAEKVAERSARRPRRGRRRAARRCRRCRPRCAGSSGARAQAPALVEPAVKALDAALTALDEARAPSRSRACAPPTTIRTSWSASRSGCSRCAPPAANTMSPVDELAALAAALRRRPRADRCRRGAAHGAGSGGARGRRATIARPPTALSAARAKAGGDARQGGQRRAQAAQARAREVLDRDRERRRRGRPERHRPRRVLGADQSRHAAGPADEGRLRRRAGALPAGAQGGAGRSRLGADAGVRRDRHRRRRRGGRRHRRAAGAARRRACRCWR